MTIVLLLRFVDSLMIYTEAFAINAGKPDGATTFLSRDLGEAIKGFSYRPAAALSMVYVLIVTSVVLCLVAGLPAAYAFARFRFIGDRHVLFLLLAFRVTPPVVLSLPIFIPFAQVNLVNTPGRHRAGPLPVQPAHRDLDSGKLHRRRSPRL